jgi:hypothetical protein
MMKLVVVFLLTVFSFGASAKEENVLLTKIKIFAELNKKAIKGGLDKKYPIFKSSVCFKPDCSDKDVYYIADLQEINREYFILLGKINLVVPCYGSTIRKLVLQNNGLFFVPKDKYKKPEQIYEVNNDFSVLIDYADKEKITRDWFNSTSVYNREKPDYETPVFTLD